MPLEERILQIFSCQFMNPSSNQLTFNYRKTFYTFLTPTKKRKVCKLYAGIVNVKKYFILLQAIENFSSHNKEISIEISICNLL